MHWAIARVAQIFLTNASTNDTNNETNDEETQTNT